MQNSDSVRVYTTSTVPTPLDGRRRVTERVADALELDKPARRINRPRTAKQRFSRLSDGQRHEIVEGGFKKS